MIQKSAVTWVLFQLGLEGNSTVLLIDTGTAGISEFAKHYPGSSGNSSSTLKGYRDNWRTWFPIELRDLSVRL
jgi:hypothetical protein